MIKDVMKWWILSEKEIRTTSSMNFLNSIQQVKKVLCQWQDVMTKAF